MPSIDNLSALEVDENNELHITGIIDIPPVRIFQKTVSLSFDVQKSAKGITVDIDSAVLQGMLKHRDCDALSEEDLTISQQGDALLVDLGVLRELRKIELNTSYTDYCLEVYRLDGSVISSKPTHTIGFNGNTIVLPEGDNAFKDTRFALMLRECSADADDHDSLSQNNINEIIVRSYPTGPRMGIGFPPGMGVPPALFWQAPGEISGETSSQGNVDAGQKLAKSLEIFLNDTIEQLKADGAPFPENVDATLYFESDAPCVFEGTGLNITYRPVLDPRLSFGRFQGKPTGGEDEIKENGNVILRYSGKQISRKEVIVNVPKNATIIDAVLRTTESFHPGGLLSDDDSCDLARLLCEPNTGVYLEAAKWAGRSVRLDKTTSASGIALGILSLSEKVELMVELQEEWNGIPSGKTLYKGTLQLEGIGTRSWLSLGFAKPVTISTDAHWILVTSASGNAVWLSTPASGSMGIFERTSDKSTFKEINIIDNSQALHRFFSGNTDNNAQPPCIVSIGESKVACASNDDGKKAFNLSSALSLYLQSQPSDSDEVPVPLTFTSGMPGIVTVYPPKIVYDVPS